MPLLLANGYGYRTERTDEFEGGSLQFDGLLSTGGLNKLSKCNNGAARCDLAILNK